MIGAERVIDEIAYALGKDPLEVRKRNLYGDGERNVTPYHQTVEDNIIGRDRRRAGRATADYAAPRAGGARARTPRAGVIRSGHRADAGQVRHLLHRHLYNQAGALVHVYTDGSIHLNHGGTEMGQGLYIKVAQVVAEAFQVDLDRVKITATTTGKVPNTSATAASSGSDLNGMAALERLPSRSSARLIDFAAEKYSVVPAEQIVFEPNTRAASATSAIPFDDLVKEAYLGRVHLSATGFYKTPKIHWDRAAGKRPPVLLLSPMARRSPRSSVDTLTGEYRVDRVDILHDVGASLNPAIDLGQIEGGFIQGMGWLTTEELWWDDKGRLRTHAPSTYKIPLASDRPRDLQRRARATGRRTASRRSTARRRSASRRSCWASRCSRRSSMAVASVADYRECPRLDAPATPERVLMAITRLAGGAA